MSVAHIQARQPPLPHTTCAQILSVLLETFSPENALVRTAYAGGGDGTPAGGKRVLGVHTTPIPTPGPGHGPGAGVGVGQLDGDEAREGNFFSKVGLTGFTPDTQSYGYRHYSPTAGVGAGSGVENGEPNLHSPGAPLSPQEQAASKHAEAMHLACKAILLLVRHRGVHLKNFMELLVSRLCQAAAFSPVAVTLHCEQILADLAPLDAPRFVRLVLPYATVVPDNAGHGHGHGHGLGGGGGDRHRGGSPLAASALRASAPGASFADVAALAAAHGSAAVPMGSSPHVRLLALHVLACAVRHLPSADLLSALPALVAGVVPSLSSALVDIRKVWANQQELIWVKFLMIVVFIFSTLPPFPPPLCAFVFLWCDPRPSPSPLSLTSLPGGDLRPRGGLHGRGGRLAPLCGRPPPAAEETAHNLHRQADEWE